MPQVARGKALVAKLRAQAGVRDPEALAAYLGRFKQARRAGRSVAEARKVARGEAPAKTKPAGGLADRVRSGAPPKPAEDERKKRLAEAADLIGDPFGEDFGDNETLSVEDKRRKREEERLLREMEKADRAALTSAIMDQGGIQTRPDLAEEYRAIPNTFKRKDGMPGDEMADYLAMYYPELGIETENDLLVYFSDRYGVAA